VGVGTHGVDILEGTRLKEGCLERQRVAGCLPQQVILEGSLSTQQAFNSRLQWQGSTQALHDWHACLEGVSKVERVQWCSWVWVPGGSSGWCCCGPASSMQQRQEQQQQQGQQGRARQQQCGVPRLSRSSSSSHSGGLRGACCSCAPATMVQQQ
jgi:hypothetical protein